MEEKFKRANEVTKHIDRKLIEDAAHENIVVNMISPKGIEKVQISYADNSLETMVNEVEDITNKQSKQEDISSENNRAETLLVNVSREVTVENSGDKRKIASGNKIDKTTLENGEGNSDYDGDDDDEFLIDQFISAILNNVIVKLSLRQPSDEMSTTNILSTEEMTGRYNKADVGPEKTSEKTPEYDYEAVMKNLDCETATPIEEQSILRDHIQGTGKVHQSISGEEKRIDHVKSDISKQEVSTQSTILDKEIHYDENDIIRRSNRRAKMTEKGQLAMQSKIKKKGKDKQKYEVDINAKCPKCNIVIKEYGEGIVCTTCLAYWHYECAKVDGTTVQKLRENEEYFCPNHKKFMINMVDNTHQQTKSQSVQTVNPDDKSTITQTSEIQVQMNEMKKALNMEIKSLEEEVKYWKEKLSHSMDEEVIAKNSSKVELCGMTEKIKS